ncbi:MAG: hypothetical protein HQ523_00250 [Lentisphaerae bacterium]|nr:hypothetical protein [Lentisphaerota bacterium]
MKQLLRLCALLLLACSAAAERDRLYTATDPSASGGIQGTILTPSLPIMQVLAIPPDEPGLVYEGQLTGSDRRSFRFEGLPMRKYDLILIYEDRFYEGLRLQRGADTLTTEDRAKIDDIVQASEPFFTKKFIHRVEGTTGRGNLARCLCTFLRDRPSDGGEGYRRTFKLIMLKDVGPGWQFVRARDLYPLYVDPTLAEPHHHYAEALGGIRVTRSIKDLGELRLTQ